MRKTKNEVERNSMETALKAGCVSVLRNNGFKGTFPNFYREKENFVALVNFQFISMGGSFCVNLGYADRKRKNVILKTDAEIRNLRVRDTRDQCRLGSVNGGDCWFHFSKTSSDLIRGRTVDIDEISDLCSRLFLSEAEIWWLRKMAMDD